MSLMEWRCMESEDVVLKMSMINRGLFEFILVSLCHCYVFCIMSYGDGDVVGWVSIFRLFVVTVCHCFGFMMLIAGDILFADAMSLRFSR